MSTECASAKVVEIPLQTDDLVGDWRSLVLANPNDLS